MSMPLSDIVATGRRLQTLAGWQADPDSSFRFDLTTQRDLIAQNLDDLHFAGVNAFTGVKVLSVLAAWKVLAKEIGVRTFCQPDSAIKKHLYDAEKVLELIDAAPDSVSASQRRAFWHCVLTFYHQMLAFQEMRSSIVSTMYREERTERERETMNGVERSWSPAKEERSWSRTKASSWSSANGRG